MYRGGLKNRAQAFIEKLSVSFVLLAILVIFVYGEEVSKFAFKGKPETFIDSAMAVPDKMVALSEYQYVPYSSSAFNDTTHQPSIMFVIDHSGSMSGMDPNGNRYDVTSALVDTLNRICPLAEIGVAIFAGKLEYWRGQDPPADPLNDDDPYNDACPGEKGGFCPLYQMNKTYQGKSGFDVVQSYLEHTRGRLHYKNSWSLNGTNINCSINASKHAMKSTAHLKKHQFIIFFSDGEANKPDTLTANDFVEGSNVPTTFTIFFTNDPRPPQTLVDFTNNVKANGYSSTNPKSDIWAFNNTSLDTLLSFVMKNVMNNILHFYTQTPKKMAVNGGPVVQNWDSTGFTFPKLFPLTGRSTDFLFDITYRIREGTDTLILLEEVRDTIERDTLIKTDFDVIVDGGASPLPSAQWDVKSWDRTISFYHNGNQVTTFDETMTPLEVRFSFDPGDARYEYTKATIELTNTSNNGRERESITLTKNGNIFSGTFPLTVLQDADNPNIGDGTFEHYARDNLVATFRNEENPRLTLDTLQVTLPFSFGGKITVEKASYFDNDAEGYVDSIYVEASTNISGGLTNAHIQEMVQKALELPGFRGFSIQNSGVVGNGFFLKVREDQSHDPQTFVTNDDKLTVKSVVLSAGGQVEAKSIAIQDRVAPIIHWKKKSALLADYKVSGKKDTLGVKFSEAIKKVSAEEPFYFLARSNNNTYSVKLREVAQPKTDSMVFEVSSVNGVSAMKNGDSLWIHEVDRVVDIVDNAQNNKNNIRRRLYVEEISGTVTVDRGFYFDNNADGYVDSLYVKATTDMEGGFTSKLVSEIVGKAVTLPAFRGFDTVATGVGSDGFFVTLKEDRDHTPVTNVTKEDKIITKKTTLSNGGKVIQKEAPIFDKVAPLIHWEERSALAILHQDNSIDDTLFVTFSEPMKKIEAEQPFYFRSPSEDKQYTVKLKTLDHPNPEKLVFQIKSIAGVDKMRDGDTLWIHEGNRAGDLCKDHNGNRVTNFQNNKGNTRRRLYVERRLLPFTMIPVAVSPVVKESIQSKAYLLPDLYERKLNMAALKMTTDNSGSYYGMIINVVPDNYKNVFEDFEVRGKLTILDAVGNQVINRSKMAWDNDKKRLIWAWSVKNRNGRYVGPGMYVCLIEIEETTVGSENTGLKETKKVLLGVR